MITDEIYEHLTYDGAEFASMPVAGARARRHAAWSLNGVAKTYAMTGWRVGWMIGPTDVIKAATNLQSHADVQRRQRVPARPRSPPSTGDLSAVAEMRAAFDRRRRTIVSTAQRRSTASCARRPEARSTPTRRCAGVLGDTIRGRTSRDVGRSSPTLILDEAEVAVVPGEAFGPSGYLRLSYALGDHDLAWKVSGASIAFLSEATG